MFREYIYQYGTRGNQLHQPIATRQVVHWRFRKLTDFLNVVTQGALQPDEVGDEFSLLART